MDFWDRNLTWGVGRGAAVCNAGQRLTFSGRQQSLVLWGPTRLGKTLFARSLGRHVYFGGLFNLDSWEEEGESCEYAVFDDMQGGFGYFHSYKFWIGCQKEFTATDKYRHKRQIKWGRTSIWCANEDPLTDPAVDKDWLLGNALIVHVTEELASVSD